MRISRPIYLRNSTAYGYSPMLRIDLVVNNLLGSAMAYGQIRIMSDGSPWRPLIHCRDIARAFLAFAEAPKEKVHNKAVNTGGNSENYRVREVADQVKRLMPEAQITYTGEVGPTRETTASTSTCSSKCSPTSSSNTPSPAAWKNCTRRWSITNSARRISKATNSSRAATHRWKHRMDRLINALAA